MEDAAKGNVNKIVEESEPDIPNLLLHLRSRYEQIKKEDMLMHDQRQKWLQSVDQWLVQQEEARPVTVVSEQPEQHEQREQPEQLRQEQRPRVEEESPALPDQLMQPQERARGSPSFSRAWWSHARKGVSIASQGPGGQPPQVAPDRCSLPQDRVGDSTSLRSAWWSRTRTFVSSISQGPGGQPCQEISERSGPKHQGNKTVECDDPAGVSQATTTIRPARKTAAQAEIEVLQQQMRKSNRTQQRETAVFHEQTMLSKIVEHTAFDSTCALMILFNSAIIGISVNHATESDKELKFTFISGYICNMFFLIELVMRMTVQGRDYFTNENKAWNIFDFSLVSFSVVEFFVDIAGAADDTTSVGANLKTIKMLRIIRVFRMFRFFRELSLMALMIVDSMKPLFWALTMLSIIIYVFAIVFTSRAGEYIMKAESGSTRAEEVERQFGSLMGTVYTLIQAMIGGVSWGVCCDALLNIDTLSGLLFLFYVAFTILAVMNIITGVFVDNAVETARTQRDFLIQKEMELREKYTGEMRDLFAEMDRDGTGTIGLEDVREYLQDPRVQGYFNALGLDTGDTEKLFSLIDDDGSGDVDVDEFLDGCLRLKGQARSIDVYAIMHDLKIICDKLDEWHYGESKVVKTEATDMDNDIELHLSVPPRESKGAMTRGQSRGRGAVARDTQGALEAG